MEKKNRKKKIRKVLLTGLAAIWLFRHFRKRKHKYTMSEKHEYYKFLG